MIADKSSTQDKNNNSEDLFLKWWKRNKSKIAVISAIVSFTIAFNLFLYQWVITPLAEKRVLETEIDVLKNTKELKENYEEKIKSLKNIIKNKKNEVKSLRLKLVQLQNQGVDQKEIELLKLEIVLKEQEIKFYKGQMANLEDQLKKANKLLEISNKSKIFTETVKMDSVDNKEINTTVSGVLPKVLTKSIILRSQPTSLNENEVKSMLKKYDFFCQFYNPDGKGFDNDFVLQKDGQVVYDRKSGLMWQQSGFLSIMIFEDAKYFIAALNRDDFAGFHDWRLPTLEEAMSLMEPDKENDLYIDPIFDSEQIWIWTSDLVKGESWGWWVNFRYGRCFISDNWFMHKVRAVRSVQSSQE